jgi:hypothetical protein
LDQEQVTRASHQTVGRPNGGIFVSAVPVSLFDPFIGPSRVLAILDHRLSPDEHVVVPCSISEPILALIRIPTEAEPCGRSWFHGGKRRQGRNESDLHLPDLKVQHRTDREGSREHEYAAVVACPACSRLHFRNCSTGKLLGPENSR